MTSSMDSTFSPASSASSSDTSLPSIPTHQADTQVILPPIVLSTPPTSMPHLSITTQLTRLAYNSMGHNCVAWASGFELFLESHSLLHHLTDNPLPLRDPLYAFWSQSNSAFISWMLYIIEKSIVESLARIKPASSL